ncbi:hypothetical protein TNCV_2521071 [Trichonephila clavipes]|nr:hypothetical protein TNCV_2521071 [Trichonephila clavipes]
MGSTAQKRSYFDNPRPHQLRGWASSLMKPNWSLTASQKGRMYGSRSSPLQRSAVTAPAENILLRRSGFKDFMQNSLKEK